MNKVKLTLLDKEKLTDDVFDLKFKASSDFDVVAGQFCTFVIKNAEWKKMRKAYSIANKTEDVLTFIIKRLENGQGWSKAICDLEIWAEVDGIYPLWTFTLTEDKNSKLFVGTGTGFAPLYFQILKTLESWNTSNIWFVFWVRYLNDVFYKNVLDQISERYPNFSYKICLSRSDEAGFLRGYVTDFLDESMIADFEEFYLCGSPNMVKDAQEKLIDLGALKIFAEEY